MSQESNIRMNFVLGAIVTVSMSFTGWMALELIELKNRVTKNEERLDHVRENVNKVVDILITPSMKKNQEDR